MSRFVEWRGKIWPRSFFDPPIDLPPGACGWCGGLGEIPEQIDEEKADMMVPCPHCRMWCKPCRAWVKRAGHNCYQETKP